MDVQSAIFVLRQPSRDERKRKLQTFSYVQVTLKNARNVEVLVKELAQSPLLFTDQTPLELAETCGYATDAVAACVARKHSVSDPTLAPSVWEKALLSAVECVPPIVGLVIVAGLAVPSRQQYVPIAINFANAVVRHVELIPAVVAILSRVELTLSQFSLLPCDTLAETLIEKLYGEVDAVKSSNYGRNSVLLRGLLSHASQNTLFTFVLRAQLFVRTLTTRSLPQDLLTTFLFGVMIQLEGVAAQILKNVDFRMQTRSALAIKVLEVMQPLGYISEKVGTQFESYLFVLNACLDTLVASKSCDYAVHTLCERWEYGQPVLSDSAAGEISFVFYVTEQLMGHLHALRTEQGVLALARRFIIPGRRGSDIYSPAVFEASHSVLLAFLATHHSARYSKRNLALEYFDQVMQLFPTFLNGSQLRTAVLTVLLSLNAADIEAVLGRVFLEAKRAIPGTILQHADPQSPPTVRSALVSTLLHGASKFSSPPVLNNWLELISSMLPLVVSKNTKIEREYMLKDFSDIATSGGDVEVLWWFRHYEGRL